MALFKYTNLNFIPSCIENGIYASRLDKINDPYEGKGIRYKDQYRVVCLTGSPYTMLMWAYYCNHMGCCIEFDIDGIEGIRPVKYIKKFEIHEEMNTQEVIESLYKKGNEWRHEKEFRIVYHKPTANPKLWKCESDDVYLIAPVKRIIFGVTSELDKHYKEALEYIKEYNENYKRKIEVSKCILMSKKYQLEADKQFDLISEINHLKTK